MFRLIVKPTFVTFCRLACRVELRTQSPASLHTCCHGQTTRPMRLFHIRQRFTKEIHKSRSKPQWRELVPLPRMCWECKLHTLCTRIHLSGYEQSQSNRYWPAAHHFQIREIPLHGVNVGVACYLFNQLQCAKFFWDHKFTPICSSTSDNFLNTCSVAKEPVPFFGKTRLQGVLHTVLSLI
jgi:hypothetical protein